MADAFAGAEKQIDQDRMSALTAVASFGRQGMEQAALAKQRADAAGSGLASANATQPWETTQPTRYSTSRMNLNQAQTDALAAIGADSTSAYSRDAADAHTFLGAEQNTAQQVNSNYYGQMQQAVPGMRSAAAAQADEYRAAYEQRQADFAAAQEQQAIQRQMAAMQLDEIKRRSMIDQAMFNNTPEGKSILAAEAAKRHKNRGPTRRMRGVY